MKRPSISFNKDAILGFLLEHGEKIAVGLVALLASGLVWGGVHSARTKPASSSQTPASIVAAATRSAAHIQSEKQPPPDAVKAADLTGLIDPWRAPEIQRPSGITVLNNPLFEEKSKRTRPEVFPIEDLHAVAGLAFVPERPDAAAAIPADAERTAADVDPAAKPGKRPKRATKGKNAAGEAPLPPGVPPELAEQFRAQMAGPEAMGFVPGIDGGMQPPGGKGRLVPYCIVTGLIPVAKQFGDYRQRFGSAGFQDPRRDMPLWSDYLVERTIDVPGGKPNWERIDLKAHVKRIQKEWAGIQAEQLPPSFLLGAERNPGAGALGYCAPLPQRLDDPWGSEAIHPWFVEHAKKVIEEQAAAAKRALEPEETPTEANPLAGPDFQGDAGRMPQQFGMMPGGAGPGGMLLDAEGRPIATLDYGLFRFVDTTVEIGKRYRYRVRLSLWNPNYNLASQHLAEPALAKDVKIPSQPSNVTEAVTVPDTTTVLVRSLRKAETKRFKPGMAEVLVLAKDSLSGNYSLRSLITETGGLANIDSGLNRPGENRVRGENIVTDRLLVDMVGRQEDRAESRTNKPTPPPEPLEMLLMQPDGTFAVASAAAAEPLVDRYIGTLPVSEDPKAGRERSDEPGLPADNPFGNPFQR
jgi:hypothetical protein